MGSIWANIWQMSWPIFIIMVLNFFVGLADVYVAGLISPEVQAAVGFVSQLYFLFILIANALSMGVLAMVSRAVGSGDFGKATGIVRQSLLFSAMVAAGLAVFSFYFYREIISAAGFPDDIRGVAEHFFKIFSLSLGPNYLLIISNAVFRSSGEVKKPLITMSVVSAVNIAGDFMLVFGVYPFPKLGYMGIAFSTAASVTLGMFINLFFFSRDRWKAIYSGPWSVSPLTVGKILHIAWPAAMLQAAWNAGTILLYNILGQLGSSSIPAIAAITNGLRIEAIIYLPAFALNMAASVLVGQNLGAGDTVRAEHTGWKIVQAGIVVISLISLVIFIFADHLASMLTNNPLVLKETARYLRVNMVSEPFMALSTILGGGLQGAGDTRGTMWIIIVSMWLIRLPLAYFLSIILQYGALGVWTAMITSMTFQGILMSVRFHRGHWKKLEIV
jgi:MATE family multidrug resistance protein